MLYVGLLLKVILFIALCLSVTLFVFSLICDHHHYTIIKISLIIYQLLLGISIIFVFEKADSFFEELFILLSLIINTISLIVFNIKNNKIRKDLKKMISILSIPAIICGLIFSINYTVTIIKRANIGYDSDLREVINLGDYNKGEAKDLLNNLYYALRKDKDSEDCLKLYGIWKDENKDNEYFINVYVTCDSMYFPPNATKMVVNDRDETKIERIYWQFNDETEITLYENKKQVEDYNYIFLNAMYSDEPAPDLKSNFENDIKGKLKSPSSAKFTYDNLSYNSYDHRFSFTGYVESENSYGAHNKEEFLLNILPCEGDTCRGNNLNYSWYFTNVDTDPKTSIIK